MTRSEPHRRPTRIYKTGPTAPPPPFTVTVLRAKGRRRLVKLFTADGRKLGTEKAALFHYEPLVCRTPREFFAGLPGLERRSDACIIRAGPGRWFPTDGKPVYRLSDPQRAYTDDGGDGRRVLPDEVRKKKREAEVGTTLLDTVMLPMFVEEPTPWAMIDWEGIEYEPDWRSRLPETADRLKLRLPDEFADASCWYQATGGAADPFKHDLGGAAVRMRTAFVLSRPLTHDQLERWLGGIPGLDPCTFRTNQEIYVGRPVFAGGLVDPMPVRSGVLEGLEDVVQVPDDLPEPRARRATIAFAPAAGALGAEGLGLLDCPAFDRALDEIEGASGSVRTGLGRAAWVYAMGVGPAAVDVAALAARLAEVGLRHRSPDEVDGYGLDRLVERKLEQAAARTEEEKRRAADGAEIFARMEAAPGPPPPGSEDEPSEPPPPPAAEPHWNEPELPPAAAAARLKEALGEAVADAFAWSKGDGPAPQVAIRGAAGLGKTTVALGEVAKHATVVAVDSLDFNSATTPETWIFAPEKRLLAEQARIAKGHGLPVQVIRGRTAKLDGGPPCKKHKEAAAVSRAGLPVMPLLCRTGPAATPTETCEHYPKCAFLNQFRFTGPGVRVMPHDYLALADHFPNMPPSFGTPTPELVIVDETFAQRMTRHEHFPLDRLMAPRTGMKEEHESEIREVAAKVRDLLEADGDPRQAADAATFARLAGLELSAALAADINPALKWKVQKDRAEALKGSYAYKLATFWRVLAEETGKPGPLQRIVMHLNVRIGEREPHARVMVHERRQLGLPDVPVILLDASLDDRIAKKFFPRLAVTAITARRNCTVVQVSNTVCSRRKLLGYAGASEEHLRTAANRLRDVRHLAEVKAKRGKRVLLVTFLEAERRLLEEGPIPGVDIVHFGALRGLDAYKDYDVVIVAGWNQPALRGRYDAKGHYHPGAEDIALALFGDEAEPLALSGVSGVKVRDYRMRDGPRRWATVDVHADPRVQAVIEQIREHEMAQAIDRLRLVYRDTPAEVLILSNIALPITVDRLVTWRELMPSRLEVAAARHDGVLPLAAGWLAERCPDLWATPKAVEHELARAEKDPQTPIRISLWEFGGLSGAGPGDAAPPGKVGQTPIRISLWEFGPLTPALYRVQGQRGSPSRALIRADHPSPEAALAELVGPLALFRPEPAAEPPPAPPAVPPVAKARFDVPEPAEPSAARALLAEQPPDLPARRRRRRGAVRSLPARGHPAAHRARPPAAVVATAAAATTTPILRTLR